MTFFQFPSGSNPEDALSTTQVFCKFILKTSLLAIPVYLGLFMISVPYDVDVGVKRGLLLATPVFEFVVAAIIYSIGFLITPPDKNSESPEVLSRMRNRTVRQRKQLIVLGSVPLLLGILSGTIFLLKAHL